MRFKFPCFWFTKIEIDSFIYQWRKEYKRNLKYVAYTFSPLNDLTLIFIGALACANQLKCKTFLHFPATQDRSELQASDRVSGNDQFCCTHCKLALF